MQWGITFSLEAPATLPSAQDTAGVTMNHKLCPLVPTVLYVHAGQEGEFCVNPVGSLLGLGAVGSLPRRNATDVRRGVSQFIVVKNATTAVLLTQAITCSIGASINQ